MNKNNFIKLEIEQKGVNIVDDGDKVQIYFKDKLFGEWGKNYHFIKIDENTNTYCIKVN